MVTQLLCSIFFAIAMFSALSYSSEMKTSGEVSQDLWIPIYPFIYVVVVGCAMMSSVLFFNFLKAIRKMVKG